MSRTATTASADELATGAILDQLVPPPGPTYRRLGLWAVFLLVVTAVVWAWVTGRAVPQLDARVDGYGGSGPVQVTQTLQNGSPVAVEVVAGPGDRPGLRVLGFDVGEVESARTLDPSAADPDPFPIRLAPHEGIQLTTWYEVTDCAAIGRSDDERTEVAVRLARGPLAGRTRTVAASVGIDDGPWPQQVAAGPCGSPPS